MFRILDRRRNSRGSGRRILRIEPLDSRDLPAVSLTWSDGVAIVTGSSASERIILEQNQADGRYSITGTSTILLEAVPSRFVVRSFGGNDIVENRTSIPMTVHGGKGNDRLTSWNMGDTLYGESGHDVLNGTSALDTFAWDGEVLSIHCSVRNDIIQFGDVNNQFLVSANGAALGGTWPLPQRVEINGAAGNDMITNASRVMMIARGGTGNDILDGSNDGDCVYGETGADVLNGSRSFDVIAPIDGVLNIEGTRANDVITIAQNDGRVHIHGTDNWLNRTWPFPSHYVSVRGGDGNDTIKSVAYSFIVNAFGGNGNDVLDTAGPNDSVRGEAGNDVLQGSRSFDMIAPNDGVLYIEGTTGHDVITLAQNDGQVHIHGTDNWLNRTWPFPSSVSVRGGDGNDTITSHVFSVPVSVYGGKGNDVLSVNGDRDGLHGEGGNDVLQGSRSFDVIAPIDGVLYIEGTRANDVISLAQNDERIHIHGTDNWLSRTWPFPTANVSVRGGDGNDTITSHVYSVPVSVYGGNGDDVLSVNGDRDGLHGEGGNDMLQGSRSFDVIAPIDGILHIEGTRGHDVISLAQNDERVHIHGTDNWLSRTWPFPAAYVSVRGGDGNDTITSHVYSVPVTVYGGNGNDVLSVNGDRDGLHGEGGNDMLQGSRSFDMIAPIDGVLYIEGTRANDVISLAQNDERVHIHGTDNWLNRTWPFPSRYVSVRGGDGNDTIKSIAYSFIVAAYGGNGNDVLDTAGPNDAVRGEAGNDILQGSRSFDGLYWNDGIFYVEGSPGSDVITLAQNDERIHLHGSDNWLNRTWPFPARVVEINGREGNDTITNIAQSLTMVAHGGSGNDVLEGLNDSDGVYGDDGNDILNGSRSFDMLAPNDGVLYVEGTAGNDVITIAQNDGRVHIHGTDNWLNRTFPFPASHVQISGQGGDDVITNTASSVAVAAHGGSGDDVLSGVNSRDTMFGDDGNDMLDGSRTFDILRWDNDDLYLEASDRDDRITFERNDGRLHVHGTDNWLTRTWGLPNRIRLNGVAGDDTIINNSGVPIEMISARPGATVLWNWANLHTFISQAEQEDAQPNPPSTGRNVIGNTYRSEYQLGQKLGDPNAPMQLLSPVGIVRMKISNVKVGIGSGTLLNWGNEQFVLTAGHVVEDSAHETVAASRVTFELPSGGAFGQSRTFRVERIYDFKGPGVNQGRDLAVLKLTERVTGVDGAWMPNDTVRAQPVLVVGFGNYDGGVAGTRRTFGPAQIDEVNQFHSGAVEGRTMPGAYIVNRVNSDEAAFTEGDSGGPDFAYIRRGSKWIPEILGVHSFTDNANNSTWSVQLDTAAVDQIRTITGAKLSMTIRLKVYENGDSDLAGGGEWKMFLDVNSQHVLLGEVRQFSDNSPFIPIQTIVTDARNLQFSFSFWGRELDDGIPFFFGGTGDDDLIARFDGVFNQFNSVLGDGEEIRFGRVQSPDGPSYELSILVRDS